MAVVVSGLFYLSAAAAFVVVAVVSVRLVSFFPERFCGLFNVSVRRVSASCGAFPLIAIFLQLLVLLLQYPAAATAHRSRVPVFSFALPAVSSNLVYASRAAVLSPFLPTHLRGYSWPLDHPGSPRWLHHIS